MSFEADIKRRDEQRAAIAADIAEYLKLGGQITRVEAPMKAPPVGKALGSDGGMFRRTDG